MFRNASVLTAIFAINLSCSVAIALDEATVEIRHPIGAPGTVATYLLEGNARPPGTVATTFSVALGPIVEREDAEYQWLRLEATKVDGRQFRVWLLSSVYPPESLARARKVTARYLLQEGDAKPLEFHHRFTDDAVLPSLGGWNHLFPRAVGDRLDDGDVFPVTTTYLGHRYRRERQETTRPVESPPDVDVLRLLPEVLIGVPHNTRQKDETRRYDDSDYEYVRLTRRDFQDMIEAGINCFRVDAEQAKWIERSDVFHFGAGGDQLRYPECLYRSHYLGPTLFLDEPAVVTRDHVLRPRLAKDPAFREALTPQIALQAFEKHFGHVNGERAPASLLKGLGTRPDVDLGDMRFLQQNLFSWETMVSSAAYQLSQREETPAAMVFEPPGRVGTSRTLPEMNMTYGCQIPPHNPGHLIDILVGFLRGGARLSDKSWGISIYGQVHRADAFGFLTHAYDLGATHFFFWTNHRLACVPHGECLALARNLRAHVENRPLRDLERRRQAAEVAILLPPGYNLGHVAMGKGSLWGLGELNLERTNREGVKYRVVMRNFFMEIERCLRLGVAFDLLWDLPGIDPAGYREVVRVREDGDVEIDQGRKHVVLRGARTPPRPSGMPPGLVLRLSGEEGTVPFEVTGTAQVTEKSAPVYYTLGANPHGVSHNAMVAWELYGPDEEDYRFFRPPALTPHVVRRGAVAEVKARFAIGRPGTYRLRVATVDMAGRTTVVWKRIVATE